MEKFKENRVAHIAEMTTMFMMIGWLLGIFIGLFYHPFLFSILLLPVALIPIAISFAFSTRDKYTSKFLEYMRVKIDNVITLEDALEVEKEFRSLAIEDNQYCLSWPQTLKYMHRDINSIILILNKQKQH